MDSLSDQPTTRQIQTGWEFTIKPYPRWQFWPIDNQDPQFANNLILTWTRPWSNGPEPLLTLLSIDARFVRNVGIDKDLNL